MLFDFDFRETEKKKRSGGFGEMLCRIALMSKKKKSGTVPVYLNVYDLTPINGYAYWLGLGVYHSGVQG